MTFSNSAEGTSEDIFPNEVISIIVRCLDVIQESNGCSSTEGRDCCIGGGIDQSVIVDEI